MKTLATITFDEDGKAELKVHRENFQGMDGHDVVAIADSAISALRQFKADVLTAATPPKLDS